VNDVPAQSTDVTFVLRNSDNKRLEKIRSVKLLFDGTEVVTWGDLGFCMEWLVFSASTSPVLTMSVATIAARTIARTCVRPRGTPPMRGGRHASPTSSARRR